MLPECSTAVTASICASEGEGHVGIGVERTGVPLSIASFSATGRLFERADRTRRDADAHGVRGQLADDRCATLAGASPAAWYSAKQRERRALSPIATMKPSASTPSRFCETGWPRISGASVAVPMTPAISNPASSAASMTTLAWPPAPTTSSLNSALLGGGRPRVALKRLHRLGIRRRDTLARHDRRDGPEHDACVQRERAVVDVPDVHLEALVPRDGVTPVDLRPSGDAGPDLVPSRLLPIVAVEVLRQEGARTDDAHVALEHVDELREFVERGRAQQLAEARETLGVRCARLDPSGSARRVAHRAELIEGEDAPVLAWPPLPKDHRRAELGAHEQGHHGEHR